MAEWAQVPSGWAPKLKAQAQLKPSNLEEPHSEAIKGGTGTIHQQPPVIIPLTRLG